MTDNKKRKLAKGLDALLGVAGQEVLDEPQVDVLRQIEVSRIRAGVYQPRRRFDEEALKELALSIAEHGILQPLVVRPVGSGGFAHPAFLVGDGNNPGHQHSSFSARFLAQ